MTRVDQILITTWNTAGIPCYRFPSKVRVRRTVHQTFNDIRKKGRILNLLRDRSNLVAILDAKGEEREMERELAAINVWFLIERLFIR